MVSRRRYLIGHDLRTSRFFRISVDGETRVREGISVRLLRTPAGRTQKLGEWRTEDFQVWTVRSNTSASLPAAGRVHNVRVVAAGSPVAIRLAREGLRGKQTRTRSAVEIQYSVVRTRERVEVARRPQHQCVLALRRSRRATRNARAAAVRLRPTEIRIDGSRP